MSPLDPAIASALSLPSTECQVTTHGGSGFSSTSKITHPPTNTTYFLKIGAGAAAELMFAGEHQSLNAIHRAVPSLCPASLGTGQLRDRPGSFFLVTEFLDLSGRGAGASTGSASGSGMTLAQKLAKLHTTPAPPPPPLADSQGEKPMFGFPVSTCCGDTPQENGFRASWAEFYADNRLRAMAARIRKTQGQGRGNEELLGLIEKTAAKVVPRLLGEGHLGGEKGVVLPVVVHGDLWSGNASRGRILGRTREGNGGEDAPVEDVVFDPSACYAHSEFELGIMGMFGGFGGRFLEEYHKLVPKTEPVEEYKDRVALYEVYHHLNHYAIFGGGYRSGAVAILERLVGKYGR